MKEYTFIYFNEERGVNIYFFNSKEINRKVNDILNDYQDKKEFESLFLDNIDNDINSMYLVGNKYMIIKGLPIVPIIKSQVIKAQI